MKKVKVYLLYKHGQTLLYAYTPDKKNLELFLEQRNPDCFNLRTVKMSLMEYERLTDNNLTKDLSSQPFTTSINGKTHTVYMIVTSGEMSAVDNRCDEMLRKMSTLFSYLAFEHNFGPEYTYAADYLSAVIADHPLPTGGMIRNALVDDLKILYELYIDTFKKEAY